MKARADCRLAPSQWETSLQSNAVPHWLGAKLESALRHSIYITGHFPDFLWFPDFRLFSYFLLYRSVIWRVWRYTRHSEFMIIHAYGFVVLLSVAVTPNLIVVLWSIFFRIASLALWRWLHQWRYHDHEWHDDVIKWKHFPRYWPFVREIHRSPVNFPHKGQWRGALMFTLICARINGWVNNHEAGDLRRNRAHRDVTVMIYSKPRPVPSQ